MNFGTRPDNQGSNFGISGLAHATARIHCVLKFAFSGLPFGIGAALPPAGGPNPEIPIFPHRGSISGFQDSGGRS